MANEGWYLVEDDDAVVPPELLPVAGLPTKPRIEEPSIWRTIAWEDDYSGPIKALPVVNESQENARAVNNPVVVSKGDAAAEEDVDEGRWVTEARDAYDNIWGFGLEEDEALATIEHIIASGFDGADNDAGADVVEEVVEEVIVKAAEEAVKQIKKGGESGVKA